MTVEIRKYTKDALTNEQYHADPAISRSGIMAYLDSARKYWAHYLNPDRPRRAPTPAMAFGSAFHTLILEPDRFYEEYAIEPHRVLLKDVGREAYEEYKAQCAEIEASGKIAVAFDDAVELFNMQDAIMSNEIASKLLFGGENESSYFWQDRHSELNVKARPDCINCEAIIDLKTISNASPNSFQRAMVDGGYHIQGAMCLEALRQVENRNLNTVINVCIEKTYPYSIGIYIIDPDAIQVGHTKFKQTLLDMKHAIVHNQFLDYSPQQIGLPAWHS